MTSATFGYHQLPNGYWIKDSDNSGPYVQSAPGVFAIAGSSSVSGGGASTTTAYPANMYWKGPLARLAAARLRGASAPARVLIFGDSNVSGQGAGTGGFRLIGARASSFPYKIAQSLGWQTGSFFGDQAVAITGTSLAQYDPRVVLGGFASNGAPSTLGGAFIIASGASSADFTFTPEQPFDKLKFWYPRLSIANTNVIVKVDGATVGTVNQTGADGFIGVEYTVALGTHTIAIQSTGTGTCFIQGIETRNSTSSAPVFLHGGWCGVNLASLNAAGNPWDQRNVAVALTPDVALLHCTINDVTAATAIATVSSNIDAINKACYDAGADVVNTVSWPFSNAGVIDGTLDKYADLLRANASSYGGAFADSRAVYGSSYAQAVGKSLNFDTLHPNAAGHTLSAALFQQLFQ